ncbi:MAG: spore coat protein [Oscillospiraceae bacterium]
MSNLSEKELTGIEEQLGAEQILVSKFKDYSQKCQDPELKAKYEQVAAKHQQHFDTLLNMLG